ncbi:serine/threonine-protein kinase gcn2 [Annulohypoxylon maeteangense]|uniref:serine/threonine-protein kinase gcn2 n=1 Tax=Annulohypoxylon maeteangense TaxID=1927788 RepID=UPI00200820F9|nr:serine/threonine-protein kinase gcn2 [Annulohypoxylon maeteangense]KAI0885185.1 serine/threonine-protein kinase gcn2 [Annulohypoxylon maeteangense]
MASKPTGPWKGPKQLNTKTNDPTYPGLKPASPDVGPKTQYTDVQNEEIMVLQAIYGDDYIEHKAANTAWKKSEPSFDIRVKALSDEEVAITLGVVFTATYPRSAPLLSLKDEENLRESTVFKLQKFIETKPKALVALEQSEPMIHELAQGLQDILEDAAQAKAQGLDLPSLEEERAIHEAELAKQVRDQQEEEERKRQDAVKEEERVMQDMIQKEVDRQRTRVKESKKKNKTLTTPGNHSQNSRIIEAGRIEFDQTCQVIDSVGNSFAFNVVTGKSEFRKGQVATTYCVWPEISGGRSGPSLALKEFELRSTSKESTQFKKQLQDLEGELETVKKVSHRNILELLYFRIDRDHGDADSATMTWTAQILTPLADKGPLEELLDLAGRLDVGKVRSWTADLLDALGHLHSHGITHQDIHPGNVLLFREQTGDVIPKLSDVAYQRELHNICRRSQKSSSANAARSTYWLPPEIAGSSRPQFTQKTDIWDLGVVFLQMIFGLDVFQKYQSPAILMDSLSLSKPLHELVARFFKLDPKKRPRAFELSSSEFLATDAPIIVDDTPSVFSRSQSLSSLTHAFPTRLRRDSAIRGPTSSRYKEDFVEEARLGKGGFGEVVKARKKLDGQIYAIKKITQRSQSSLTEILKEVRLLSQLSHPAVVRYYNTWLEEIPDMSDSEEDTSTEDLDESRGTNSQGIDIQVATSTGGLDFISSSHPNIEFGSDESDTEENDESEESDDDEDDESDVVSVINDSMHSPTRVRSNQQKHYRTVMYISMEYCEKRTLRDLIQRNLWKEADEIWRLFRQILEGLVHIHGLNIVHRDLKPENVFIGLGPDGMNNVKIGDFGLATSGHFAADKSITANLDASDLTRSIGTSYYVAPEVRRTGAGSYTSKVDMYSLGIIFFEMCYHPVIGMERADKLGKLGNSALLPDDFQPGDKIKSDIVLSLVTHDVKERPSSIELLRSGKLPIQMENETTRRALASLTSSASPYYPKVVSALFSTPVEPTKDYTWDMTAPSPTASELLYQSAVKEELISVFRRHGAVEAPRSSIYPRSSHYSPNQDIVQLLDQNGTVVQLPFDLMLGNARVLAKHTNHSRVRKSFTFGSVYRDRRNGAQPLMIGEVDFDIVSTDTLDLALKEAEVMKVLDEIIDTFPSTSPMCFHLGHSDLLQLIFDFCNVDLNARRQTAESLSKLNIHSYTFQKIRAELRSPLIGISATSIEDLKRFDFRDTPAKAFAKLKTLFEGSRMYEKLQPTLAHLKDVVEYTKRLGVHAKIYVNPLSSVKENFFSGGMLFQCLYDKKFKDVFAAGGRYDSLIKAHQPKIGEGPHAVGFSLAWDKLARPPKSGGKAFLKKPEEEITGIFNTKRCDVLVASFDAHTLRTAGIEILSMLWSHDISAELARDSRSPEELTSRNRDETYSWIVIIKQDNVIKIRTMDRKEVPDAEISASQLLPWLRIALRERGSAKQSEAASSAAPISAGASVTPNPDQEVRVLVAGTRSKKFNRLVVIEQAQANAAALLHTFLDGPIAAVETSDVVLDLIQETALSEAETWRRAEQSVDKSERRYVREIHDMLKAWRSAWENKDGGRHAFVYNFRTTKCICYDLGA